MDTITYDDFIKVKGGRRKADWSALPLNEPTRITLPFLDARDRLIEARAIANNARVRAHAQVLGVHVLIEWPYADIVIEFRDSPLPEERVAFYKLNPAARSAKTVRSWSEVSR